MARCTSVKCQSQLEELIGQQEEQRRLVQNQLVNHAANVAAANSNLLHGIFKTLGVEDDVDVPLEVPIAGEISSDLYGLSWCDILNLTFCRLDFHQLLIKIS